MVLLHDLTQKNMDKKTKINTMVSIVLISLIAGVAYWAQVPTKDLKAELVDTNTVLVRIQDFAFDPDVVRIEPETTVSWLNDESKGNSDVQHAVSSYNPEDASAQGVEFESGLMSLGDTFSFTFNKSGVFYYNCSLHPFMTGKICVGKESEALDPDCVIEDTKTKPATGVDDTASPDTGKDTATGANATDDGATAGVDATADTTTGADTSADTGLEGDIATSSTDENLLPAADEDFNTSSSKEAVVQPKVANNATTTTTEISETEDDTKLASSGPEDTFYLLVAFFALFMGHKLAPNRT